MILPTNTIGQIKKPIDYVNMMIGTTGKHKTEYGGTTPAVSSPFGMTQWCPTTRINGISKTMYHYNDTSLIGFMATHQPAIWMGDYGFFTLMPQQNKLKIPLQERKVKLNRNEEIATPYYYKIKYSDESKKEITTELTATSRCSFFHIQYSPDAKPILFIEAGREKEGGYVEIIPESHEIRLYNKEMQDAHLGPKLYNFKGFYVLKFSQAFTKYGTWINDTISPQKYQAEGASVGAYVEFPIGMKHLNIRIGSSFISYEQAEKNLQNEIPSNKSFTEIAECVKNEWNKNLSKIQIQEASEDDLSIFYTAFFRTLQYPREFSEYGKYYSPFDDKIHQGISYNAYSLWDTFRAQHPWLLITSPERVNDMITALIQMYQEGGWIPKWPNPSYTNIMIGTHGDAVIADAFINGYRGYDIQTAYQAIRKNAFTAPKKDSHYRWGDRDYWNGNYEARGGLSSYIKKGYVASDKTNESVARTLEFALDDYCIAQMAKELGYQEDYNILMKRAKNYTNLYNHQTGFFQARKLDGNWDNSSIGFTEGANWTYRFCVMQDIPGMIKLMGGENSFIARLDSTFDFGHYRHDNEPCHHYAYLYNACNHLEKTQKRIPQIIEANYKNKPDGLSGNDDCGQMSAWYLFSTLGFYPITPTSGEYAIGIPHFKHIQIELPKKKKLIIKASGLKQHPLLPNVRFNEKYLNKPYLSINQIMQGGILEFLP